MPIDIKSPTFPESVADGTVAIWHKQPGDPVRRDEPLVDIETDKVALEIVAPADGTLKEIIKAEGETVLSGELIGLFEAGEARDVPAEAVHAETPTTTLSADSQRISPAARRLIREHHLDAVPLRGNGKGGLVTQEDVEVALERPFETMAKATSPEADAVRPVPMVAPVDAGGRVEKRVPMTRMRMRIAERLLDSKQGTAMLTTFNEVDMKAVMDLRKQYKEIFEKKHGVKLGFMGFFVKSATEALKQFPMVNASIDGHDIVYHGYQDVGIAVSTDKGLVVPILRDTDLMSIADIERVIVAMGVKARDGKLSIEDMQGGTFTITNGGIFGSMMSTPILNPPQAAILGMHKIQERPVAIDGKVVIRPMMYLALSYDHRLIDGKDSVQFLSTIKELLEAPARLLLDI